MKISLVVPCYNEEEAVAGFYRKLGFRPMLDDALCLYLPLEVLRQTRA